jgi:hypothetical protein
MDFEYDDTIRDYQARLQDQVAGAAPRGPQ